MPRFNLSYSRMNIVDFYIQFTDSRAFVSVVSFNSLEQIIRRLAFIGVHHPREIHHQRRSRGNACIRSVYQGELPLVFQVLVPTCDANAAEPVKNGVPLHILIHGRFDDQVMWQSFRTDAFRPSILD